MSRRDRNPPPELIYTPRISLTVGTRIGTYEILSALGAGGMGEVYRARDTKLNRDVAIKVLLPAVANDPDRLARFSREAQVLASLNHPNIAHIHGLEESNPSTSSGQGGVTALVMELVEGEDLSQRISRGPISTDEALPIARQIAEALEAAHDHGIIHRDLKPANIKLRSDGTVKVLDFGLAKQGSGIGDQGSGAANSPTLSMHATEAGIILGTAAYMSPEQARGKFVDRRTDIWAFGAVLFEMLTSTRAFRGDDATDTIVAVVSREPDWSALPPAVPFGIRQLLRRTLEKDPRRRLDSAAALRIEIDDAAMAPASEIPASRQLPRLVPWAVAALAIVGAVTWTAIDRDLPVSSVPRISRFEVHPPSGLRIVGRPEFSPDGSLLVYPVVERGVTRLFLRRLDQFEATPLAGTEGASSPFFSPDGHWLGFAAAGKLQKIDLTAAAAPIVLATVERPVGFNWSPDGTILLGEVQHGLSSISAEGGERRTVMQLTGSPAEVDHHNPVWLPGGNAVLFTIHDSSQQFSTAVQSLISGGRKVLIESSFDARYSATGHLVYGSKQAILAVPFDLSRLELTGPPVTLVDHVIHAPFRGTANFGLSSNGALVYQPEQSIAGRVLTWVDRSGAETPLRIPLRGISGPRVSPDGRRLAFSAVDGDREDIWTYELATDRLSRVTLDGTNLMPVWTSDGRRLTYLKIRDRSFDLVWQPIDGGGPAELLISSTNSLSPAEWAPNNQGLIYFQLAAGGVTDVLFLRSDGDRRPQATIQKRVAAQAGGLPAQPTAPSLSPDGRWLAYVSSDTGRNEVYVEAFPPSGSRHLITVEGGNEPKWSRDGRELFFRIAGSMFAVPVRTAGAFAAGKPARLFTDPHLSVVGMTTDARVAFVPYDVAPDGRFLMVKPSEEEQASPHLNVVLNWADELTRRVPAGKPR